MSAYTQRDYRRFLSAHLQFLQGLCQLSLRSASSSTQQFLSALFITAQLLSEDDFTIRLSSLINETIANVPVTLNRLLALTRMINHGNIIVSTYGTNFEYIPSFAQSLGTYTALPQAVIYDGNCSCGLRANCTTQANFIDDDASRMVPVNGIKMGCTASESFRLSTLECFYDQTCLDLIQHYANHSTRLAPLDRTAKRFPLNATVDKLINDVFIEEWTTSTSYITYFHKCSPALCSYTQVQRFDLVNTITLFLALQGGLSIVLKWVCPQIVQLLYKIYQHRHRQISPVQPISAVGIMSIDLVPTKPISSEDELPGYVFSDSTVA